MTYFLCGNLCREAGYGHVVDLVERHVGPRVFTTGGYRLNGWRISPVSVVVDLGGKANPDSRRAAVSTLRQFRAREFASSEELKTELRRQLRDDLDFPAGAGGILNGLVPDVLRNLAGKSHSEITAAVEGFVDLECARLDLALATGGWL